jgi:ATP-dependent DNA helicase RecG
MSRLLEGDVGSGKTLVAAAASYLVTGTAPRENRSARYQVAYMAPTEILAQQHFDSFIQYLKDDGLSVALITGSGCRKFPSKISPGGYTTISRAQLLKWVASGEISMVVGTHALIQKAVLFKNLGLVVIDEQHRFGISQRKTLAKKGKEQSGRLPHLLSMTAKIFKKNCFLNQRVGAHHHTNLATSHPLKELGARNGGISTRTYFRGKFTTATTGNKSY